MGGLGYHARVFIHHYKAIIEMALTTAQRKHLKALAHARKPVVQLGNAGVTEAVLRELDRALERHELLKVRLPAVERSERSAMAQSLREASGAELVQEIGRVAVLYRPARKPRLTLPG
jgi:RNA-binding protein